MAEVRNKATGEVVTIADDELGDYVLKGFQVRPGTLVPVMIEGQLKAVSSDKVPGVEEIGGSIATGAQVAEVRKEREYAEGAGAVRGGVEAFGRGATLGASDLIATGLGADPEGMKERRERGGALTAGLEVAGNVAPMLFSGGSSLLGRGVAAVGAPVRGVAAGGKALGALATKALGGPSSRLARMAGTGVAGGFEGGAFGAGMAASEAALEDSPLTAEQLLAHMGTGAVLGGGVGSVLGAASRAPRGLAGLADDVIPEGAASVVDEAIPEGAIPVGPPGARPTAAPGRAAATGEAAEATAQRVGADGAQLPTGEMKGFFKSVIDDQIDKVTASFEGGNMERLANKAAFSSARPQAKQLRDAQRYIGEDYVQKIGNTARTDLPALAGKPIEHMNQVDIFDAATRGFNEAGERMGNATRAADDAAQAAGRGDLLPDTDSIYAVIKQKVLDPLEGPEAGASSRRIAKALRDDIDPYFSRREGRVTTFQDLKAFQKRFSDTADDMLKRESEGGEAFRDARRAMEKEIEDRIEHASAELNLGTEYKIAKDKYKQLRWIADSTKASIDRDVKNRLFSLTDYGVGTSAFAALGAGPGALLMGLALGTVNKIARERGSAISAGFLGRFAKTQGLQQAAAQAGAKMKGAVGRAFDKEPRTGGAVSRAPKTAAERVKTFTAEVKEAQHLGGNPAAVAARVNEALGEDAAQVAPAMTAAAVATAIRGVDFLRSKAPTAQLRPSDILSGQADRQRVSDTEQAKFLRYVDAVKNPAEVIEDFGDGTITPEAAEALRTVYPEMFAAMEKQILTKLADPATDPSYQQLTRFSRLLGRPLHPTMEPAFIAAVQAMHAATRGKTEQGGGAPSSTPATMTEAEPTTAQRVSAGGM